MTVATAAFTPTAILMRSAASNLPFVGGLVFGAAALGTLFHRQQRWQDGDRKRSAFMRELCRSNVEDRLVIHYDGLEDPIAEAMRALSDPAVSDEIKLVLRTALAASL